MGEKLQTTFPLKVHNRFTPKKIHCILLGRVCTKFVYRLAKFQILDFCKKKNSFSLTWDRMGENTSSDISEST